MMMWCVPPIATPPPLQFFEAAAVEGHAQAPAVAALGRFLREVEHKGDEARACYKRALALDPAVAEAGDQLCAALIGRGKGDTALALCREIAVRAPQVGSMGGGTLRAASRVWHGIRWNMLKLSLSLMHCRLAGLTAAAASCSLPPSGLRRA